MQHNKDKLSIHPANIPRSELQQKLWKYIGYLGFSRFAASDNDFFAVRRFDVVSVRVLLAMEDRLSQLEESLARIGLQSTASEAPDLNNGSFRQDPNQERVRLLAELQTALLDYSGL